MERVIVDVRRHWFGAQAEPLEYATRLLEPSGEMLVAVDAAPSHVGVLVSDALRRGTYVSTTNFSRPRDLGALLRQRGFRQIQRQGAYIYNPSLRQPVQPHPERRGLFSLLRRRPPAEVTIQLIGAAEMREWNEVCCRAFGTKIPPAAALADKLRAFESMGSDAVWYLARQDGRAVGTACLYRGRHAAQVLAVGTVPAVRGQGVATALMVRLLADWEAAGEGFLFLDTTPGSPAERIYRRLGFHQAYLRDLYAPECPLT